MFEICKNMAVSTAILHLTVCVDHIMNKSTCEAEVYIMSQPFFGLVIYTETTNIDMAALQGTPR